MVLISQSCNAKFLADPICISVLLEVSMYDVPPSLVPETLLDWDLGVKDLLHWSVYV